MTRQYYSQRTGTNPNMSGLPLVDVKDLFLRVYNQLAGEGYFTEAFGYECVDAGPIPGTVVDPSLEILLAVRKRSLWPIGECASSYSEDDLFDVIEFLFQNTSKPVDGSFHSWNECGMHWETFNRQDGQKEYRERINRVLEHYEKRFELSTTGEVLHKAEAGFERIFEADLPSSNANVADRVASATLRFRRHGASFDDRRQAVRDLADVLEYLRADVKSLLASSDEKDLFNLANNFGIRHHNDHQKTDYDAQLWLGWMFYFYLSTIHVLLRKMERRDKSKQSLSSTRLRS